MKNLAVITARSGSKGIKDKNIKELLGKPLLAYSIESALQSGCFSEIMVSTDSEEYSKCAKQYGASVPFLRSETLSGDSASSWDVLREVLQKYNELNMKFDSVCLLQPTSPLRKAEHIVEAYSLYVERSVDAITSVCEVEHSPLWCMSLPEDNSLSEFRKNSVNKPRQELKQYYRLNGSIFIRRVEYLGEKIEIKSEKEYAYIMPRKNSVDIDTMEDFEYAEYLLQRYK